MSWDVDEKEFYEGFAEITEDRGLDEAKRWAWSALDWTQKELRERDKENDELRKNSNLYTENLPKPHEAGKPSELAQRVTEAFRSSAADAVAVNLARGNTVVGEVNGEWISTRDERAAVVAWLREYAAPSPSDADNLGVLAPGAATVGRLADNIECGEHRREEHKS
jgi:hypothetical protein